MMGKIRDGLALLAIAAIAGIAWLLLAEGTASEVAGGVTVLCAIIGLVKIAAGLLRSEPARD